MRGVSPEQESKVRAAARRYQVLSTTVSDQTADVSATFVVYPSPKTVVVAGNDLIEGLDVPDLLRIRSSASRIDVRLSDAQVEFEAWPPLQTITVDDGWVQEPVELDRDQRVLAFWMAQALDSGQPDADPHEFPEGYLEIDSSPETRDFAHHLVTEPLLPFRSSPISGQAFTQLLNEGTGVGSGAVVGMWAGWDHGLLLIATVPGGMIVGGAAYGVGMALQHGLHDRVLRWIAGSDEETSAE